MERPVPGLTAWLAIALLAVSACSSPASSTPAPAALTPSAATTATWKPRQPLPRMEMSEDEKHSRRLAALDLEREAYGLEPMAYPELVRWVYPEEVSSVMVPCLRDKGFIAFPSADGTGITSQTPSAQNQAFTVAYLECTAMYTPDPRIDAVPHEIVIGATYDYWSQFVIPCVRELGLTMEDMPTRETWMAKPALLADYPFGNPEVEVACPYNLPSRIRLGEQ